MDAAERKCPYCKSPLHPVVYYIAREGKNKRRSKGKEASSKLNKSVRASGGICLKCGLEKEKAIRAACLQLVVLGILCLIASSALLAYRALESADFNFLLIVAMASSFGISLAGLAVYLAHRGFSALDKMPWALQQSHLSDLFVEYAKKEHPKRGTAYLSTTMAENLNVIRS
jgi:hypothetical protein